MGVCQSAPFLLNRAAVYEVAIASGYFCVSGGLYFLSRGALTASGLMFGLAIASRPHLFLAGAVTLLLNADLKVNSSALGTAQWLANRNCHFDAGFVVDPVNPASRLSQALEVDSSGNIVWGMQINAQEYRSYRMDDLYTPPVP